MKTLVLFSLSLLAFLAVRGEPARGPDVPPAPPVPAPANPPPGGAAKDAPTAPPSPETASPTEIPRPSQTPPSPRAVELTIAELDAIAIPAPVTLLSVSNRTLLVHVQTPAGWVPEEASRLDVQMFDMKRMTTNAPPEWISAQIVKNPISGLNPVSMPYRVTPDAGAEWVVKARIFSGVRTEAASSRPISVLKDGQVLPEVTLPLVPFPRASSP